MASSASLYVSYLLATIGTVPVCLLVSLLNYVALPIMRMLPRDKVPSWVPESMLKNGSSLQIRFQSVKNIWKELFYRIQSGARVGARAPNPALLTMDKKPVNLLDYVVPGTSAVVPDPRLWQSWLSSINL